MEDSANRLGCRERCYDLLVVVVEGDIKALHNTFPNCAVRKPGWVGLDSVTQSWRKKKLYSHQIWPQHAKVFQNSVYMYIVEPMILKVADKL